MNETFQINFAKLPLSLKETVDKIGEKYRNKNELLTALVAGYEESSSKEDDIELDTTAYQSISDKSKEDITHLFKHLLSVVDNNFLSIKTESLALVKREQEIETMRIKTETNLAEAEKVFEVELKALQDEKDETVMQIMEEHKGSIAQIEKEKAQIEKENKKLLEEVLLLKKEKKELEKDLEVSNKLIKFSDEQHDQLQNYKRDNNLLTSENRKVNRELDRLVFEIETIKKDAIKSSDEKLKAEKMVESKRDELSSKDIEIAVLKKELQMIKESKK